MDRGAWQATVHGVPKELGTTEQVSIYTHRELHSNLVITYNEKEPEKKSCVCN